MLARLSALIAAVFWLSLLAAGAAAQQQGGEPTLQQKRQFVRTQMIREFADSLNANLLAEIDRKIANMSAGRIDQLIKTYQRRQQTASPEVVRQQAREQALRDAKVLEYQQRLAAARSGGGVGRRPGFAPVITTLPSGTSLGASAVISPDRRYVRMNLQPFFSSVGPVQTFTFQNPTPFPNRRQQVQIPFRPR